MQKHHIIHTSTHPESAPSPSLNLVHVFSGKLKDPDCCSAQSSWSSRTNMCRKRTHDMCVCPLRGRDGAVLGFSCSIAAACVCVRGSCSIQVKRSAAVYTLQTHSDLIQHRCGLHFRWMQIRGHSGVTAAFPSTGMTVQKTERLSSSWSFLKNNWQ